MPIVQAIGSYSIGRDCNIVLMHPLAPNGRVDIPNVTGFSAKQVTASVKSDRLDGQQLAAELPKGWTGEFHFDRGNVAVDALFAAIEAVWYFNGSVPVATVYQYIAEANGSVSTFEFTRAALKYTDAGAWTGDQIVKQQISFEAAARNLK